MSEERRSSGLLRVPFVRRCRLDFAGGPQGEGFLVNINVLGAYVAWDETVRLGQGLRLSFGLPGSERELEIDGLAMWINTRQAHPVHSLPRGFGVRFVELQVEPRECIERLVADYVRRHPHAR